MVGIIQLVGAWPTVCLLVDHGWYHTIGWCMAYCLSSSRPLVGIIQLVGAWPTVCLLVDHWLVSYNWLAHGLLFVF